MVVRSGRRPFCLLLCVVQMKKKYITVILLKPGTHTFVNLLHPLKACLILPSGKKQVQKISGWL